MGDGLFDLSLCLDFCCVACLLGLMWLFVGCFVFGFIVVVLLSVFVLIRCGGLIVVEIVCLYDVISVLLIIVICAY